MGACVSNGGTPEEVEQRQKSKAIDLQLRAESKQRENVIKILLLGEDVIVVEVTMNVGWEYNEPGLCV